jgi:glycosyltransferase involved in cell wall biosynthesis
MGDPMQLVTRTSNSLRRRAGSARRIVRGALTSLRARFDSRPAVIYISEGTDWVIDEIGHQIATRLQDRCLIRVVDDYRGYRNCTLHFGSPPIYFNHRVYLRVHPSNRLLLTWTHGLPGDPDPATQLRVARVTEGAKYLARIEVATTTARDFLIGRGVAPEKIVHIPLGVDTRSFHPPTPEERQAARARLGVPDGAVCIGSFQKDSPGWDNSSQEMKRVKGPDVLVDVLERLAERHPIFVLLTAPSRGYVIGRLEQAGIPYRHDVLRSLAELPPYYHALDLYLITSRDEGGPMSMLEAMASGVPLVSTRMGIPKDAIRHGENGMLADIEDVEGLTDHAQTLIGNPDLAVTIASAARQIILDYDWDVIADKYARLLYDFSPEA